MEIILIAASLIIGGSVGYIVKTSSAKKEEEKFKAVRRKEKEEANKELENVKKKISQAETKAQEIELEAKRKMIKMIDEAKKEEKVRRIQLEKLQQRLIRKEETIDEKLEGLEKSKIELSNQKETLMRKQTEIEKQSTEQKQALEKVAKLTKDEAKEILLKKVEEENKPDLVKHYKQMEENIKEEAEKKARWVIGGAIQKYAAEVASESTATLVDLPNDEMKGRVIGREGRNINTFEQLTGVDVIVDDTPGSIVISGFDLVRRYIAKRALEKLIEDGRIHPTRIEDTISKAKKEVNVLIKEFGEKAAFETGVTGLHPDLIKLLGRLRFRTSYGQNVLKHSMEVSFLAGTMAAELGADEAVARKAGLLHDIGKSVDHEITGSHALIGRDICKKFGLPESIIHPVSSHHEEEEPKTIEALLVQAADTISSARPGARKESLEAYIKRLKELEGAASSFEGVEKTFAIQAGREVRVIVKPEEIDDLASIRLANNIAKKIEQELDYPGQIKVNVVRETRAVDYAK